LAFCAVLDDARAQEGGGGLVPVDLELVLAVDTSASVDSGEFRLQMRGVADAFRDPAVVTAIELRGELGIAVTLVQWSQTARQSTPWAHIHDRATADAFAQQVEAAPRALRGHTTAIGTALNFSAGLIAGNRFKGFRRSIDVSGDGRNNADLPILREREKVFAQGVTINGLAILNGDEKLLPYYKDHVIGGLGAFAVPADDYQDFARAMRMKLLREIQPLVAGPLVPDGGEQEPVDAEEVRPVGLFRLQVGDPAVGVRLGD